MLYGNLRLVLRWSSRDGKSSQVFEKHQKRRRLQFHAGRKWSFENERVLPYHPREESDCSSADVDRGQGQESSDVTGCGLLSQLESKRYLSWAIPRFTWKSYSSYVDRKADRVLTPPFLRHYSSRCADQITCFSRGRTCYRQTPLRGRAVDCCSPLARNVSALSQESLCSGSYSLEM